MTKEQLFAVIKAAMEAAVKITQVTPNTTDDKIAVVAQLIVNQVLEIFGDTADLTEEEFGFVAQAAQEIKTALES